MQKVRIGFIGCGKHATRDLFPLISKVSEIELIATCDLDEEKARNNANRFGSGIYYTDYNKMLNNENIDAVIIVGAPMMHYEIGMACLEKGLHIFIEKPSALTIKDSKTLAEKADLVKKVGQVGYFLRHSSAHQLAKSIIDSKDFGNPVNINCSYYTNGPWEPRKSWGLNDLDWTYMLVQGVHLIDIVRHFMGEIVKVQAQRHLSKLGRLTFAVNVEFESGSLGSLSLSSSCPNWSSYVGIIGDNGTHVKIDNGMLLTYENQKNWTKKYDFNEPSAFATYTGGINYTSKPEFGYYGELKHFADAILLNKTSYPDLSDGYKAIKIAELIISSSNSGELICL